ncbi:MAG: hypothetical protein WDW36_002334 [Sanguina aurantia]
MSEELHPLVRGAFLEPLGHLLHPNDVSLERGVPSEPAHGMLAYRDEDRGWSTAPEPHYQGHPNGIPGSDPYSSHHQHGYQSHPNGIPGSDPYSSHHRHGYQSHPNGIPGSDPYSSHHQHGYQSIAPFYEQLVPDTSWMASAALGPPQTVSHNMRQGVMQPLFVGGVQIGYVVLEDFSSTAGDSLQVVAAPAAAHISDSPSCGRGHGAMALELEEVGNGSSCLTDLLGFPVVDFGEVRGSEWTRPRVISGYAQAGVRTAAPSRAAMQAVLHVLNGAPVQHDESRPSTVYSRDQRRR